MDRITQSLLNEFCQEYSLTSLAEDRRFEHFSAYLAVSRHYSEAFTTTDIVTGSGGDTGIDAIAVIINGSLVTDAEMVEELASTNGYLDVSFIFVQAERSSSFETSKIGQFSFGVVDFFSDKPSLSRSQAVQDAAAVMQAVYERSSRFRRGNPSCRMFYVTTGKWVGDSTLQARQEAAIADLNELQLFRDVEFIPVDADLIRSMYQQTRNSISREFTFQDRIVVPDIPGVSEAYLGIIPALDFLPLIQDESGELMRSIFYDNVRDWQDYNPVNSDIRDTLKSDTRRNSFALLNNGITVIAKTLRATGNKIYLEDYQIVNGCQTSHVLYHQKNDIDSTVMVPLRLISTQDEDIIAAIIRATNRQTEVRAEQLLALSDFQKKLERYFETFPDGKILYYERRSRQFSNLQGIEKTRIVTPSNLIRAFASMFLEEPHRTTRNYKALRDRVGDTIFGSDHRLEPYYLAAAAQYRLEFLFRNQLLDAKYKPARYHILLAFRMLSNPSKTPRMNSHEMQRFCDEMMEVIWDSNAAERNFQLAARAVDEVAKGNFHRDHIRTLPFTEALLSECKAQSRRG